MPAQTETLAVPKQPADRPEDQRAIHIPTFLSRILPYYGQPAWLEAQHWRQFVRSQPVAIICRDTLIQNMLNLEWDIVPRSPDDSGSKVRKAIDYYKELFTYLEDDFDIYLELLLQDMLDLPFGACSEVGRWDDEPDQPVIWAEHIDSATLFPTGNPEYPVAQRVPDVPGVQVVFPHHAVNRMYMTPRPELRLEGWGMAPPQKIYIAIDMLYKGDQYYWKMLIDTPEAGILDLIDMSQNKAEQWLDSFRDMFRGIDGFKIPVLYEHDKPAEWIPLNRPPLEMLYDKSYMQYSALVAGAYGLRLSDIGLAEISGEKTLAGVIRGERQSKRTGRALVRSKTENHFNAMLPEELRFIWKDDDTEEVTARGRAIMSLGQGLKVMADSGFIDEGEGRAEIVASSMFKSYLDPDKEIEKPEPPMGLFGQPGQATGTAGQPQFGGDQEVPATDGGRGSPATTPTGSPVVRADGVEPEENVKIGTEDSVLRRMEAHILPSLRSLKDRAESIRLRRLIRVATRELFEDFVPVVRSLTDEQIEEVWLPEMLAAIFDEPNALESPMIRRDIEEAKEALERSLSGDQWWRLADALDKALILDLFIEAYEYGLEEMALDITRTLFLEGFSDTPILAPGIVFDLVHQPTIDLLERMAADLVTNVDSGTKFFLKRMITAGVRKGLSSPSIAAAIRDGDTAERILRRDDYNRDVEQIIRDGLIEMSEYRSNSIVNTEINRAENLAHLEQIRQTGLTQKRWLHLGKRGTTAAGNVHPCPTCQGNEDLGLVSIDFVFPTVFKSGGVDGEGGELTPPGHPSVCHCTVTYEEDEVIRKLATGEYAPWTGFEQ
jgi:hypothetical protein